MPRDLLIHAGLAEVRIAVLEDGVLVQYWLEQTLGEDGVSAHRIASRVGDIVLGRVQRVLPAMEAAFVDVGLERAGFLGAREARPRGPDGDEMETHIKNLVREGETVLLQIMKDPIGDKGARLTGNLSLPGRLLVLLVQGGVSLSRRICDESERARLHAIVADLAANGPLEGAGYIVRTAAIGASAQELRDDAERLRQAWREILAAREGVKPPATLYHDIGVVERALRDDAVTDIGRILIDDSDAYEAARAYAGRVLPAMHERIQLYSGTPLFEAFGVEDEIATLTSPVVPLPCGGWITIETTEALIAIDVNSGSYVGANGLEGTSLAVNLEAAEAIGRQLTLRGLGGLIVVDFIHMADAAHSERVRESLAVALARGKVPAQISPLSEFGLIAITRKRVREPLERRFSERCADCGGRGRRKSTAALGLEMLRAVEHAAAVAPGKSITVRAAPEIVSWFQAHQEGLRHGLARRGAARLTLIAEAEAAREAFDVESGA